MEGVRVGMLHTQVKTQEMQIALILDLVKELKVDVKLLRTEADRARERDAIYDRWLRMAPLLAGLISAGYWVMTHLK